MVQKPGIVGGDDAAAIAGQLERARAAGLAAHDEIERLEQARPAADSYDDAVEIGKKIERARWEADRLAMLLPALEEKLCAARFGEAVAALGRLRREGKEIYGEVRAAMLAAADVLDKARRFRERAAAEIGSHLVEQHLPRIGYAGMMAAPQVREWAGHNDRTWALPWTPPQAPAAVPSKPAGPVQPFAPVSHGQGRTLVQQGGVAPPPVKKPAPVAAPAVVPPLRVRRQDPPPAEGESRVTILRPGMHHPVDGKQLAPGDIVNLPSDRARILVDRGIADFARKP